MTARFSRGWDLHLWFEGNESNDDEGNESNDDEENESREEEEIPLADFHVLFEGNDSNDDEEIESSEEEEILDWNLHLLFEGNESNDDEEEIPDWNLHLLFEGNESNDDEGNESEARRKQQLPEQEQSVLQEVEQHRKKNSKGTQEEVIAVKAEVATLETPKALVTSLATMKINDIQSLLQSAFEALEYHKVRDGQFDQMEAECVRVKAEREQLVEKSNKLADDLQKTKHEVQTYKQKFEQKSIQMEQLQARFAALKQDLKRAKEDNCRIYKQKEKMTEDLEFTRLQVEYYKRIDNLKGALKSVAEFPGLRQVLQRKNNSGPDSSKAQTGVCPEVSTKRRYVLKVHEIDHSVNCSICLEPWSESAEHSICSLACGHFFGRSCITRWINRTGTGSSKCPQCLRTATLKDIRNHYVTETFVGDDNI